MRSCTPPRTGGRRSAAGLLPSAPLIALATVAAAVICGLAPAAARDVTTVIPSFSDSLGAWESTAAAYFPSTAAAANSGGLHWGGSTVSLADWYNDLNAGLLVLSNDGSNSSGGSSNRVELWTNKAASDGATVFVRQWASSPLPESPPPSGAAAAPSAARILGAVTADLRRSGSLDIVLQGSDGQLYIMVGGSGDDRGSDGARAPLAAQPLRISAAPSRVVSLGANATTTTPTSFRLHRAASPQVAVAVLASSDYPSLVFVNQDGQLIELRWTGSDNHSDKSRSSDHTNDDSGGGDAYAYEAHVIVSLPAGSGAELVLSSLVLADIDGDCVAELLYAVRDRTARTLSVYAYQPSGFHTSGAAKQQQQQQHAKLIEYSEANGELGSLSVADVDGDGAADLVLPWRPASSSSSGYTGVMVFYSSPALARNGCRATPAELSLVTYTQTGDALVLLTEGYCGGAAGANASTRTTTATPAIAMPDSAAVPLILRAGDYNRDGRVDLVAPSGRGPLVLTATGGRAGNEAEPTAAAGSSQQQQQPAFVCAFLDRGKATAAAAAAGGRDAVYTAATPFFAALSDEVGRLDVVLTSHAGIANPALSPAAAAGTNAAYRNAALPDRNYYILASALNGVPAATAASTNSNMIKKKGSSWEKEASDRAYGLAQPGAVHYLSWEDIRMRPRWTHLAQLSQSVGYALQPPRVLVGLGETFSYIRGYSVGVAPGPDGGNNDGGITPPSLLLTAPRQHQWPAYLVPNSQVFAVLDPVADPDSWRLRLHLPTSRYRLLLGIVLLVLLVAIGVPIVLLRWGEMRADFREWKRR